VKNMLSGISLNSLSSNLVSNMKAEALLQMKYSIFDNSFILHDNLDIERMAKICIIGQVSHSSRSLNVTVDHLLA
jgi:hypothetical protein